MSDKLCMYFTTQELDYIGNVLADRPFKEVGGLLANMQQQLALQQARQKPEESPPVEKPKPKGKH
jgi:hypothetical protein